MINSLLSCSKSSTVKIDKSTVQKLLGIAQSDHEKECTRYAVFKASVVTSTPARKLFGFENIARKAHHVEACINSVGAIREAIDDLATYTTEDEALLASFGILPDNVTPSESKDSLCALSEAEEVVEIETVIEDTLELEKFKQILCDCKFNWFDIIERCSDKNEATLANKLDKAMHKNA